MKFPSMTEMAKEVAEKALDDYEYQGKTIRQWIDILKNYDDKQATLQRIVERLEEELSDTNFTKATQEVNDSFYCGLASAYGHAIEIVKEEGGLNV